MRIPGSLVQVFGLGFAVIALVYGSGPLRIGILESSGDMAGERALKCSKLE